MEEEISTGFRDLDKILSGLHKSELIIIGSRPGMGKTTLSLEIAQYAAAQENRKVLFYSLEFSKELIGCRLYTMETGVDISKTPIEDPKISAHENVINDSTMTWDKNLIVDDTPGMEISQVYSGCNKYHPDLVVIDYLQLLSYSKTWKPSHCKEEISAVCQEAKKIAEKFHIPVVLTSVLQRYDKYSKEKRPNLMYMQLHCQENQIADVVLFIYRDELYHEGSLYKGIAEITVAKQSHGPLGRVYLSWMPQYIKLADLTTEQTEIVIQSRQIENQGNYHLVGGDVEDELYDGLEQTRCLQSTPEFEKISGFSTGFHSLDKLITGLHNSDLILFAGCDNKLNTDLAYRIAFNVHSYGGPRAAYFKLNSERKIPKIKYDDKLLTVKEMKNPDITDIHSCCQQLYSENDVGFIVIDTIQDIRGEREYGPDKQNQKIYDIMKSLKQFAVELDIPILVLSELYHFEKYNFKVKPQLLDIQGEYRIDQVPDVIAFIYNVNSYTYSMNSHAASEIIVEKQPYGPPGTTKFAYEWDNNVALDLYCNEGKNQ